ncbi:MAG TPA: PAS domain S-box protein [Candidatus Acidoferrum sp.]|nr:PAS domain S-box protein [Candidatus Acidoferrum sp.]
MTISTIAPMIGSYDYGEVARSLLIAIAASYVGLDLTGHVTAATGRIRLPWLSGGAGAMGIGIWAMHFKGMLAFHLPVSVAYHWPTIFTALLVAILASVVAMYVASRQKLGWVHALTASVTMGAGIAGLHYICMAAMRLPAVIRYSPFLVTVSILLAVLFSLIALVMALNLREETKWTVPRRLGSAMVMGAAISAMHYTGMAAASFFPASLPDLSHAVNISALGNNAIAIVTLIVLVGAMVTSSVDRRARAEAERLNQDLERLVAERTLLLEAVNQALRTEIAEHERAREDLRRSEDRLRLVIDTIPQQIWSGPPDGSLDFCNAQWRFYMGLTQEELQGEGWQRMLHPEDRERVLTAWRESVANGTPYEQEERHRRADGQYRWFLARGVPLRDTEGRIVRWFGSNTDIEDRKGAEDRLRLIIDTLPAMVWSKLPDGSADFLNQRFREYTGLSVQEGLGWGWMMNAFHPEDRAQEEWRAAFAAKKPFEREARLRRGDRAYRWFLLRAVPLRDKLGAVVKWYGTTTDIEDRKHAEEELRKQKEVFQKIFENIPVMIVLVGQGGRHELVNREWERTIGWTLAEIREQNLDIYAEAFPDPQYRQMVLNAIAASTGTWTDFKVRVRSGRIIDVTATFVHLSDGTSMGIGQDITERKGADAALRESQAELARVARIATMGELTASIAHEINQPLAAVATNASASLHWLDVQPPNLAEAQQAMANAMNEANRASGVIERLRTLLKKVPPQLEPVNVNEVIREVLAVAHKDLMVAGVAVLTELSPDVPNILGDRVQLQQVMLNLIMNAIDSMITVKDRPRTLVITSARDAEGGLIRVQDSGKGLDPDQMSRIFESFFTTKPEGIGMGLSISRSIVEAHGGRLWAMQASPHGAVFQLILPKAI